LTAKICRGKKVNIVKRPYVSCREMLLRGDVDFLVYRQEQWLLDQTENITVTPIDTGSATGYLEPAVLVNKENYNIAGILKPYLSVPNIAEGQKAVLENRRRAVIF
jgi:hypothetical protein